ARRTWRFFEAFVSAESHDLPPDNFQETPKPVLAHRTSPTNLGLYLLSVASARDFGWIGDLEAIERLEATLATMSSLARYRGHFYNWYDTKDLRPLDPKYVSAVDSGNLAGHLFALAGACREWATSSNSVACRVEGVRDALLLARQTLAELPPPTSVQKQARDRLVEEFDRLTMELEGVAQSGTWSTLNTEGVADAARAVAIDEGEDASADLM